MERAVYNQIGQLTLDPDPDGRVDIEEELNGFVIDEPEYISGYEVLFEDAVTLENPFAAEPSEVGEESPTDWNAAGSAEGPPSAPEGAIADGGELPPGEPGD